MDRKQEPEFHKPEVQSQTRQLGTSWQGDLCCSRTPDVLVSFLLLPDNIVNKENKFIVIQMLTFPAMVAWLCCSWVCVRQKSMAQGTRWNKASHLMEVGSKTSGCRS